MSRRDIGSGTRFARAPLRPALARQTTMNSANFSSAVPRPSRSGHNLVDRIDRIWISVGEWRSEKITRQSEAHDLPAAVRQHLVQSRRATSEHVNRDRGLALGKNIRLRREGDPAIRIVERPRYAVPTANELQLGWLFDYVQCPTHGISEYFSRSHRTTSRPTIFPVILFTKWSRAQAGHVTASYESGLSVGTASGTQTWTFEPVRGQRNQ